MRKRGMPPGGRRTSAGRITLTIPFNGRRLSQNKILPSEPKSYADEREAWAGYERVLEYIESDQDRSATLLGFWEEWTDPEHPLWGKLAKRSEQSILSYKTRTNRFVQMFGDRPIDSIVEDDVLAYLKAGGVHSSLRAIATLFHDAERRGMITKHPAKTLAAQADVLIVKRRKLMRGVVPSADQIEALLARTQEQPFPRSFYGWLLTGVRTGMRGGELDGMEWEYLDGNRYRIRRQINNALKRITEPKHGSTRDLLLPPDVMEEIERHRDNGSQFIWSNGTSGHWSADARDHWWRWCSDGGQAPRQIVGGCTMYRATRHYWASWALNVAGISPYQAALLYGHSDGGKLLTETYAQPDHERAMREALEAWHRAVGQPEPIDLDAERQRREAS